MKLVCFSLLFLNVFTISAQTTEGIVSQKKGSAKGYVLYSPLLSKNTYLINKCGKLVHSWTSGRKPAQSVYLLPDGSILRSGDDSLTQNIAAVGGWIERYDWNNKLTWSYSILNELERQHHDIYPLPNGHVLAISYRKRSKAELAAAGRKPSDAEPHLLAEELLEIKPIGCDSGQIVWRWDVWDHLVQDVSPSLPSYGVIAQNPQLFNINYSNAEGPDWLHFNSVSYNAELDEILISNHEFSEFFIIDHSTTMAEAASHKGGKRGKGGDILYRWGNPAAYNAGKPGDQTLFRQHNAHWIEKGMKDEGKIMVFNNGVGRPGTFYSSVDIIEAPVDKKGGYRMEPGKMAGPAKAVWSYSNPDSACFFSKNISGAQRLANGNTLVCAGAIGKFFEIDPNKNIVWTFTNLAGMPGVKSGEDVKRGPQVFRCTFYEPSYAAFKGRGLELCETEEINPSAKPCFSRQ